MSIFLFDTHESYSVPTEFALEKLERLTAALSATTEPEIYECFGLKAPTITTGEATGIERN